MLTDDMVREFQKGGAEQYVARLDSMSEESAKSFATKELIQMGVLNQKGEPKKTIVTGDFFGW